MTARSGLRDMLAAATLASVALAGPALAQKTPGPEPSLTAPGPAPVFPNATAGWVCGPNRCYYVKLSANALGQAWGDCVASWWPSHGGWRKQTYCR